MKYDALVVGGGLAGSAVAIQLAHAGCDVVLIEKTASAHDSICGEFLSKEALHYLGRLGLDPLALGAVPIERVRIARGEILAEAALPFRALSLRRRDLDQALLQRAEQAGATICRGKRVQTLTGKAGAWCAHLGGREPVRASAAFLANGKQDLQGRRRGRGWQNDLVGFKMYFQLPPAQADALAGSVELLLFPGGYAGLQPINGGLANLCLLVTRKRFQRCGSGWPGLLQHLCQSSAHLARRLAGAVPALDRPLALSSIPYGYLATTPQDGLWRVGDQAAVIPSFSGDGMSIALHSGYLAARMFLDGRTPAAFALQLSGELRQGIHLATAISHLLIRLPASAAVAGWHPMLLRRIAAATRIPERSMLQ